MTPEQLRAAFQEFAGTERSRRFVLQLRGDSPPEAGFAYPDGRGLRFWQEELWGRFATRSNEIPKNLDTIRDVMLWCDVHDRPLENGSAIPDRCGLTGRDGERLNYGFTAALESRFPFGFGFWALVCPRCVVECDEWMADHAAKQDS